LAEKVPIVRKLLLSSFVAAMLVLPALPSVRALNVSRGDVHDGGDDGGSACGPGTTFCAGAARGDITPPVTTPMWGYTARELGFHAPKPLGVAGARLAAGAPADALSAIATDPWVADKTGGDTEGYCKTFVCNQGIHTRLFANAFVLQDRTGTKLAVVETDLGGLPEEAHQAVADRIVKTTGIDAAHLLISATHTHQGPGGFFQYQGYALLGGDQFDPRVFAAVTGGIARAVEAADGSRAPARMAWGQAAAPGNHNRRMEQYCLNPEAHCGPPGAPRAPGAPNPANDTLTVIRLDTTRGEPIGMISNFANHGTIGGDDNLLFSGDNQAFAVRMVEAGMVRANADRNDSVGDGVVARTRPRDWPIDALLNGAQGDQSPNGNAGTAWQNIGGVNEGYASMEGAGRIQAPPALALWRSLEDRLSSDVTLDARMEELCFCGQAVSSPGPNADGDPLWDHVSATPVLGTGATTGGSSPVPIPTQGKKLPALAANGSSPQATRLQQLRIGDLLMAALPGEATVAMGRRIIDAVQAAGGPTIKGAIIAGLANDYVSYFTTHEEYRSYLYESAFSLYGPQEGQLLLEEQVKLAGALRRGEAVAPCSPTPVCPSVSYPSAAAVDPVPVGQDPSASVLKQPAKTATQYDVVSFAWVGGSPSAEWVPQLRHDRVVLMRRVENGPWVQAAADSRDTATLLVHTAVAGQHQWSASWDITRDMPAGVYRFVVDGYRANGQGGRAHYSLASDPITVRAFAGACPPRPDPTASFRFRDGC
jgi:neutral ceramidase